MLTRSLPVFLFTKESIFSHANNIHTIFSTLPFEEIRLSQSQCKELVATALGFADLKQLKAKLELCTFADITMPSDAIEKASKRILELTSPLPFSTIEIPDDGEKYIYPVHPQGEKHLKAQYKIFKNDLLRVKSDWNDWHIVLAKYVCSYLKETMGNFEYFNNLKLSSQLITFPEQLFHFTNSKQVRSNLFLNSVIYNHLIVHCPTEPNYSEQLKAIPKEQRMYKFDVYLSLELKTYIEKNESNLHDLQECKVRKELPLILSYVKETETAKVNILPDIYNFYRMNKAKVLSIRYKEQPKTPEDIMDYLTRLKLDKFDIMSKCEFELSVINKHANLPEIEGIVWPEYIHFTQDDLWDFKLISSTLLRDLNFGSYLLHFTESGSAPHRLTSFNEKQLKVPECLSFGFHFMKRLDVVYTSNKNEQSISHGVLAHLYMRYEIKADLSLELMETNRLNTSLNGVRGGIKRNNDLYESFPNLTLRLETFEIGNPEMKELANIRKLKSPHIKMKGFKETMTNGLPLGVYKQHIQKQHAFTLIKAHQNVLNTYKLIQSQTHIKHTDDMNTLIDAYVPIEHLEPQM